MLWFASGRASYENPRRLILRSLQPARTDEIRSLPIRSEWSRYTTSGVAPDPCVQWRLRRACRRLPLCNKMS